MNDSDARVSLAALLFVRDSKVSLLTSQAHNAAKLYRTEHRKGHVPATITCNKFLEELHDRNSRINVSSPPVDLKFNEYFALFEGPNYKGIKVYSTCLYCWT